MDNGERKHKRHACRWKSFKGSVTNGIKHPDFINKRLREKNEARVYINNMEKATLKYYQAFTKQIKP